MKEILFINACVRPQSRTKMLAEYLLSKKEGNITVIDLQKEDVAGWNWERLSTRDQTLADGDMSHPILKYASQFAAADEIIIAAPYWDLSFPAWLKCYLENCCVVGITFSYDEKDQPYGMCKASSLTYITTAGGPIYSDELGYGYVRTLCNTFYGISNTNYIKAECLDLVGADVEGILKKAKDDIDRLTANEE